MGLFDWLRGLFTSDDEPAPPTPPPTPAAVLTGQVQSVGAEIVVMLDDGRFVHCAGVDGFASGDRVSVERVEVEGSRSVGAGLRKSDSKLEMRHIPELDGRPTRAPPTDEELVEIRRSLREDVLERRSQVAEQRRAWLHARSGDRDAALREAGADLRADLLERIAALRRPCLRLIAVPDDHEGPGSRLGGRPFLPSGTPWPEHGGRPLSFMAQLQLSELPDLGAVLPECPRRGRLLFFYDAAEQPWGFDPEDAGSSRVLFFEDEDAGALRDFPSALTEAHRFPASTVSIRSEPSVPAPFSEEVGAVFEDLDDEDSAQWDAYWELYDAVEETPCGHQLGGHPHIIQNPMAEQCELVSRGANLGGDPIDPALSEGLAEAAADWTLLLQLDSDEDALDWMWGDLGKLYVWVRRSQLARGDFGDAWVILQCT